MKTLALFFASLLPALAMDPPAPPLPSTSANSFFRAELLIVRLPAERALELQPELRDATRASRAQEKLLALVKSKEARLIDWPLLTLKAGNRGSLKNVHELRYATDYEAPRVVAPFAPSPAVTEVKKPKAPVPATSAPVQENGLIVVGGAPRDFATREVGVSLECELNLSADQSEVEAMLSAQHVEFLGYQRQKLEIDQKYSVIAEQPEFQTQQTTTQLSLPLGQVHLLAFHQLKKPENTVELFVVKFSRIDLPKAAAPASPSPAPPPR